jgi:hypothetical protein
MCSPPQWRMTIPLERLHHFRWRCRDAEQTGHFDEGIPGMPVAHVIGADPVPWTGEYWGCADARTRSTGCLERREAAPQFPGQHWIDPLSQRSRSTSCFKCRRMITPALSVGRLIS